LGERQDIRKRGGLRLQKFVLVMEKRRKSRRKEKNLHPRNS